MSSLIIVGDGAGPVLTKGYCYSSTGRTVTAPIAGLIACNIHHFTGRVLYTRRYIYKHFPCRVDTVDPALEVGSRSSTSVIVNHGLHKLQPRRDVIVGDGAGPVLTKGYCYSSTGRTVTAPIAGLIACNIHHFTGRVLY